MSKLESYTLARIWELNLPPIEKSQHKNNRDNLRHYWRFFIPLALLLALMVKFPLRIDLREAFWDAVFYGIISLICIAIAIRVYRLLGKPGYRLIATALLCSALSGWQIIDMAILRYEGPSAHSYAGLANAFEPLHDGFAWYNLRFPSDKIMCHTLFERYIGNNFIAIAYDIDRNATWFACGG